MMLFRTLFYEYCILLRYVDSVRYLPLCSLFHSPILNEFPHYDVASNVLRY